MIMKWTQSWGFEEWAKSALVSFIIAVFLAVIAILTLLL